MIADLTTPSGFDGRAALVTGGGSGIGRATVQLLVARGARVVAADIDPARAAATVDGVADGPGTAHAVGVDVTSSESVAAAVTEVADRFGRLDIAVNAAGISGSYADTADRPEDEWRHMLEVNLTGVFLAMQAELHQMLADADADATDLSRPAPGVIVNVSSGAGDMGVPGLAHYSAAKHGVVGLTRSAALEYARRGIRVNAVLPGPIRTPMLQASAGGDAAVDAMGRAMPMRRVGEPAEVAQTIAWLCCDQASYVTGHLLAVDGGALAT